MIRKAVPKSTSFMVPDRIARQTPSGPLPFASRLTDESIERLAGVASAPRPRRHLPASEKEPDTVVDFTLTDEQKDLRELAHDFAEKEIRPVAWDYDRDATWPQ